MTGSIFWISRYYHMNQGTFMGLQLDSEIRGAWPNKGPEGWKLTPISAKLSKSFQSQMGELSFNPSSSPPSGKVFRSELREIFFCPVSGFLPEKCPNHVFAAIWGIKVNIDLFSTRRVELCHKSTLLLYLFSCEAAALYPLIWLTDSLTHWLIVL